MNKPIKNKKRTKRIYIDKIEWKETTKTKNNEKKERIYLYKKHKEKTYKKNYIQKRSKKTVKSELYKKR